jgi:hypothetical protein
MIAATTGNSHSGLPPAGKRLECPQSREPCIVKGGDARTLPMVYDIFGA